MSVVPSSPIISEVISSSFKKTPSKFFVLVDNSIEVCCVISRGAALSIMAVAPDVTPVIFLEVNKLKSIDAIEKSGTTKPEVDFRATGFLIDRKGYLITNAHVISRMKNIYIENRKGEFFKAEALYSDKEVDLAILKITDTAFKAVSSLPYSI